MDLITKKLINSLLQFRTIHYHERLSNDLNLSQMKVLLTLAEESVGKKEDMIMSKLSSHCGLTRPALTQIINRLEIEGYVRRKPSLDNRREVIVMITERGLRKVQEEKKLIYDFFTDVVNRMGKEETKQFITLLDEFFTIIIESKKE